jgi:hypothetical protein
VRTRRTLGNVIRSTYLYRLSRRALDKETVVVVKPDGEAPETLLPKSQDVLEVRSAPGGPPGVCAPPSEIYAAHSIRALGASDLGLSLQYNMIRLVDFEP